MSDFQLRLETLTRKWWFYLAVLLLFFLPAYSSTPFDPRDTSALITAVLSAPLIYSIPILMPLFKLLPILVLLAVIVWGNRATRLFDGYVAITLLLYAFFQNTAVTRPFGVAVVVGNVAVYSIVAVAWVWETAVKRNSLTIVRQPLWRYWVVPMALFAFWFPVNPGTLGPDFSLTQLLTNSAGLTLCMMLPVYLAILTLCHPAINRPVLRLTSFAGLVTAGLNVLQWFFLAHQPWLGIVHLPLLTISLYAWVLSYQVSPASRPSSPA